ncbi:MAG: cytidine deaminase [Actinomycetota bacterium]
MTADRVDELIAAATAARERAHAPYSGFRVGAALLAGGRVYAGVNVEIASYPLSVCAERNAIAAMVLAGGAAIEAVAVVTDADATTTPCGGCRQALWEFGHATDPLVVCATLAGARLERRLSQLLPDAFGPTSFVPGRG